MACVEEKAPGKRAQQAVWLYEQGLTPIPLWGVAKEFNGKFYCRCERGFCDTPGKHPILKGWTAPGGLSRAAIEEAFTVHRYPNIGCLTGSSSQRFPDGTWLIIIDIDIADGKPGVESLRALEQVLGVLPRTVTVVTGSGGTHLYFRTNKKVRTSVGRLVQGRVVGLAPGVDTRGEGGQGVLPPSLHFSGAGYAWAAGCSPDQVAFAMLPDAWEVKLVALGGDEPKAPRAEKTTHRIFTPSNGADVLEQIRLHPLTEWATENPDELGRELWRAFATNIAALVAEDEGLEDEGRELCHEISEGYSRYSRRETDRLFTGAVDSMRKGYGPTTFERMVQYGAPRDLCTGGTALVAAARRAARGGRVVDSSAAGWLEGDDSADVRDAMVAYSAANEPTGPEAWPLHERGTCPVCCAASGSFYMHVVEEDPEKPSTWECNSPEHGKLALASGKSIGWPDDRGAFHGWQIHIDAFKAGKGVKAYLVETGYLA